jgi:hypothetical protein
MQRSLDKGTDERVQTVEQPSYPAHGRMDHNHVARANPEAFQIFAE